MLSCHGCFQIGDTPNPELRIITSTFNKVLYKGETYYMLVVRWSPS